MDLIVLLSLKEKVSKDTHLLDDLIYSMAFKLRIIYVLYSHMNPFLWRFSDLVLVSVLLDTAVHNFINVLKSLRNSWSRLLNQYFGQYRWLPILDLGALVSSLVKCLLVFFLLVLSLSLLGLR